MFASARLCCDITRLFFLKKLNEHHRKSLIIDVWTFRFVLSLQNRHLRLFLSSHWSPMAFTESNAWLILLNSISWFSTPALHLLQLHNYIITKRTHNTKAPYSTALFNKKSNIIERLLGWYAARALWKSTCRTDFSLIMVFKGNSLGCVCVYQRASEVTGLSHGPALWELIFACLIPLNPRFQRMWLFFIERGKAVKQPQVSLWEDIHDS